MSSTPRDSSLRQGPTLAHQKAARPQPRHCKRRFWEKLSGYNLAAIILSPCATFLAIAFIAFVWAGAAQAINGNKPPSLWRKILEHQWATRVVTLSAVLIRVAAAAQLGVFAAMVPALILETTGAPVSELPFLSISRCVNAGPQALAWRFISRRGLGRYRVYAAVAVVAVLNAMALQFTSTILISDFGTTTVALDTNILETAFGVHFYGMLGNSKVYPGVEFWKTGPTQYPRFAELSEAPHEAENYVDTGHTYRAYLPLDTAEKRQTLRSFSGPTAVVDARVICIGPSFSSFNVTVVDDFICIMGSLSWEHDFPALQAPEGYNGAFNCAVPLPDLSTYDRNGTFWDLSLCWLDIQIANMLEGVGDDGSLPGFMTRAFLFLNATGKGDSWEPVTGGHESEAINWHTTSSGPWSTLTYDDVGIDSSLCFTNPTPSSNYFVEIRSANDQQEPTLKWNTVSGTYGTYDIRRMLGATSELLTHEERGIFELQRPANWSAVSADDLYDVNTHDLLWSVILSPRSSDGPEGSNSTTVLTPFTPTDSVHRSIMAIIQDILQDTTNPALALQALFTLLTQMAYYDFFPQFDVRAPSAFMFSSSVLLPVHWAGFEAVMTLLVLHFILILLIVVLFLEKSQVSLLGNAWQAVAQVVSKDTADVVEMASGLKDCELNGLLSAGAKSTLRIGESAESGRIEAMRTGENR